MALAYAIHLPTEFCLQLKTTAVSLRSSDRSVSLIGIHMLQVQDIVMQRTANCSGVAMHLAEHQVSHSQILTETPKAISSLSAMHSSNTKVHFVLEIPSKEGMSYGLAPSLLASCMH